jgi:hypothetical protein
MDFAKISNYTIEIYFVLFYFGQVRSGQVRFNKMLVYMTVMSAKC